MVAELENVAALCGRLRRRFWRFVLYDVGRLIGSDVNIEPEIIPAEIHVFYFAQEQGFVPLASLLGLIRQHSVFLFLLGGHAGVLDDLGFFDAQFLHGKEPPVSAEDHVVFVNLYRVKGYAVAALEDAFLYVFDGFLRVVSGVLVVGYEIGGLHPHKSFFYHLAPLLFLKF